jgi:hypothetical protein
VDVAGHIVEREEAGGVQELAAVANLTFKTGLRSRRTVEAMEVKAVKGIEDKAVPLLAVQQKREPHIH